MIKLGVDTERIQTPIIMTESLCNPSYSRSRKVLLLLLASSLSSLAHQTRCFFVVMTELLFESYGAPSVAFGLDSLFSFYENEKNPQRADGLVVSSGTSNTHVIPVLGGKSILGAAKK